MSRSTQLELKSWRNSAPLPLANGKTLFPSRAVYSHGKERIKCTITFASEEKRLKKIDAPRAWLVLRPAKKKKAKA